MKLLSISLLLWCLGTSIVHAQVSKDTSVLAEDTANALPSVIVRGYLHNQTLWQTPVSVAVLHKQQLAFQPVSSLVSAMNTIPGIRMEERSPGSYRLSIRGSLIRSPYGVRDVKIYYNDMALTTADGNTYLNALNTSDIEEVEVLKGPDGSLFGSNSGGVVLLRTETDTLPHFQFKGYGGSYGLVGEALQGQQQLKNHLLRFRQSYQRADGYRDHSANHRLFLQLGDQWKYHKNATLDAYAFYSKSYYQTPGGLTLLQYDSTPRAARYPTATIPGPTTQKAAIYNEMFYAGLRNQVKLSENLDLTTTLWGSHVAFKNPFLTNYEKRNENNLGFRTYLAIHSNPNNQTDWHTSFYLGAEGQREVADVHNYDNNGGTPGNIQAYSNIVSHQIFGFSRMRIAWKDRLVVEMATSLNYNGYYFRDTTQIRDNFHPVWMPHFAINYKIFSFLQARATLSKGYSTPTTAEIRPSNNIIYTELQPEKGWNTEAGLRLGLWHNRLVWDASVYRYVLSDGIISRTDSAGNTFFVNSGKIKQKGIESALSLVLLQETDQSFIHFLRWRSSYTYAHYIYDQYQENGNNYSGNNVAGVARNIWVNSLEFHFPLNFDLFIQHNYTGKMPLNDANTVQAKAYNLLYARIGYKPPFWHFIQNIYFSVDNILNQKYSLGNDLNAFGGRYYNTAPGINFQTGFSIGF